MWNSCYITRWEIWSLLAFDSHRNLEFRSYQWSESEIESLSVASNSLWPHGLYRPWNSPGQNTGVGSLSLLQGIFPTQESNPASCIVHGFFFYQLSHKGSPRILEWVAYSFFSGSCKPRNGTGVSCIAGRFFTNWANRSYQYWL